MMQVKGFRALFNTSITTGIISVVMLLLFLFSSCSNGNKQIGQAITERDSIPSMSTYGVVTFVSDSGVTRYRIDAEEWLVYDRKEPAYWAFEKGIYLEQFDSLFHKDASIKADTAYNFYKDKLWKLIGNVDIQNQKGERFNTELLYWDQAKERIYSDRFIRIQQTDRIISGYGFTSNQQMTVYEILNMEGIIYVEDESAEDVGTDSIDN